jgi:hypothetical protein
MLNHPYDRVLVKTVVGMTIPLKAYRHIVRRLAKNLRAASWPYRWSFSCHPRTNIHV